MTKYQLTNIISDAEKRIIQLRTKINDLKPQVEDYKKLMNL